MPWLRIRSLGSDNVIRDVYRSLELPDPVLKQLPSEKKENYQSIRGFNMSRRFLSSLITREVSKLKENT